MVGYKGHVLQNKKSDGHGLSIEENHGVVAGLSDMFILISLLTSMRSYILTTLMLLPALSCSSWPSTSKRVAAW